MCGIIGVISDRQISGDVVSGLQRLEYRGYDSAGIATFHDGVLDRRRAEGKLRNLVSVLAEHPLSGSIGIGHTRWATHGVPNEINAHPHSDGKVAVVHNGIIENFSELRAELQAAGHLFETETDTEAVVHLISALLDEGLEPKAVMQRLLERLEGAFALAIILRDHPDQLLAARRGSPLAIGYGQGEMFLGSDAMALAPMTREICYLAEGDWAILTRDGAEIYDEANRPANREVKTTNLTGAMIGKGEYRHYMLKEIYEQPAVIGDTLRSHLNPQDKTITFQDIPFDAKALNRLSIVACGTAYYSGAVAKYWIEELARLPVETDVASEFRYRNPPLDKNGATLVISQSGETIDTLEGLRQSRRAGQSLLSIVNVPESTIARESDAVLQTLAGPEIGVASTKAFTTQLTVQACLAIWLGEQRGTLSREQAMRNIQSLVEVPMRAQDILNHDEHIKKIADFVAEARDVLYLGRHSLYPIAMEGALKLKEISYIHAEGYAAGEMKHGPIALIDENVPVIVCAPSSDPLLFDKTASNVEEVVARGGKVVLFSDAKGVERLADKVVHSVTMPDIDSFVAPILYALPIQLLAYHVAVAKGTDVDQPRNLAKSVTVE